MAKKEQPVVTLWQNDYTSDRWSEMVRFDFRQKDVRPCDVRRISMPFDPDSVHIDYR